MTNPIPSLDGTDYVSVSTEYFKIGKAAELLGCTAEDLLHLGAKGKVEILAPSLAEGIYEWILPLNGKEYPELAETAKYYFDASERILLSWKDVAIIEARGWTIPKFFYSPFKAQEFDELLQSCAPEVPAEYEPENTMTISRTSDEKLISSVTYSPAKLIRPSSDLSVLRKALYFASWHPTEPLDDNTEKTTISNLFISKVELERLKVGSDQDAVTSARNKNQSLKEQFESVHGNTERHAQKRESILAAAIFCNKRWPAMCESVPDWVSKIELEAEQFWPVEKAPPLTRDTITRMLNAAIKGKSSIDKTVE